jgi:hypothetical protein
MDNFRKEIDKNRATFIFWSTWKKRIYCFSLRLTTNEFNSFRLSTFHEFIK